MARNNLLKIFVAMVLALTASSCIFDNRESKNDLKVGDKLPDFSVTLNDGSVVTGAALRKGVSVILFFTTTCPDCHQMLPEMQRIYDHFHSQGVDFALISREESEDKISAYWQKEGLNMPYSPQTDRKVYNLFATSIVPRVYVSDKSGIIRIIFTDNPVPTYSNIKTAILNLIE